MLYPARMTGALCPSLHQDWTVTLLLILANTRQGETSRFNLSFCLPVRVDASPPSIGDLTVASFAAVDILGAGQCGRA